MYPLQRYAVDVGNSTTTEEMRTEALYFAEVADERTLLEFNHSTNLLSARRYKWLRVDIPLALRRIKGAGPVD